MHYSISSWSSLWIYALSVLVFKHLRGFCLNVVWQQFGHQELITLPSIFSLSDMFIFKTSCLMFSSMTTHLLGGLVLLRKFSRDITVGHTWETTITWTAMFFSMHSFMWLFWASSQRGVVARIICSAVRTFGSAMKP